MEVLGRRLFTTKVCWVLVAAAWAALLGAVAASGSPALVVGPWPCSSTRR